MMPNPDPPRLPVRVVSAVTAAAIAAVLLWLHLPMVSLFDLSLADLGYRGVWIGGGARQVTAVVQGGPADHAGLQAGDVLEFDPNREADWILASYRQMPEGFQATLPVRHADGTRASAQLVPDRVDYLPTMNDRLALLARLAALTAALLLATLLVWSRPGPMTWSLFLVFAATGISRPWVSYYLAFQAGHGYEWAPVARAMFATGAVMLVPFALYFPRKTMRDFAGWKQGLGLLAVLAFGWFTSVIFRVVPFEHDMPSPVGSTIFSTLAVLSLVAAMAILWQAYARAESTDRARLKWALAGISVTFVAAAFTISFLLLPYVLSSATSGATATPSNWASALVFGILFPLAAGYAVLSRHVVDVQFTLSRALVVGVLLAVALAFVSVLHWLLGRMVEHSTLSVGLEALAAVGAATALYRLRPHLDRLVGSVLFRRRHLAELRLRQCIAGLAHASDEHGIAEALVVDAARHLDLASAALFYRDAPGGPLRRVLARGWSDEHAAALEADALLVRYLQGERGPLRLRDAQWLPAGVPQGAALPVLAIPLLHQRLLSAVVLYGAHANATLPDPDEVALLYLLAQAAAAAHERLRGVTQQREGESRAREDVPSPSAPPVQDLRGRPAPTPLSSASLAARATHATIAAVIAAFLLWAYWPMVKVFDLSLADPEYSGVWIGGDARQVTAVVPGGAADRAGLRAGDVLEFDPNREADWVLASYRQMPEGFRATLPVRHADGSRTIVTLAPERIAYLPTLNDRLALLARLCAFTLGILFAVFLVWASPGLMTWSLFFVFASSGPVLGWINYFLAFKASYGFNLLPAVRGVLGTMVVALVYFAASFPHKTLKSFAGWKLALGLAAGLAWGAFVGVSLGVAPFAYQPLSPARVPAFPFASSFCSLAAVGILWHAYAKAESNDRARLKWALAGMSAVLVALVAILMLQVLPYTRSNAIGGSGATATHWTTALVVGILWPLATGYAILRQRVVDLQFVVSRALVFGIELAIVLMLVAALHWVLGRAVGHSALTFGLEGLAVVGLGLVLYRFRQPVQRAIDSVLFRQHHLAEQRLRRVVAALPYAAEERSIAKALVQEPARHLNLASAALFFRDSPDGPLRRVRAKGWGGRHVKALEAHSSLVRRCQSARRPLSLHDAKWLPAGLPEGAAQPVLAIPLRRQQGLVAIVLYGAHDNSTLPDPDEVALLAMLAQAAVASHEHLRSAEQKRESEMPPERMAPAGATVTNARGLERPLEQDSSIPGNRKDGFRYRHLLFIIVATPIYLWFELSFGVHLLDGISSKIAAGDTDAIEHWGRFISGCAVALLFLSGWVRQCEKLDTAWPARILGGVAISIACLTVTWWFQGQLIDFYIHRSTTDIGVALVLLLALVIAGFFLLRAWIRFCARRLPNAHGRMVLGLIALLGVGYVLISGVSAVLPTHPERLGLERQRAATLTLVRQSIQHGYYGVLGAERDDRTLSSAEGKAFLALFTVFGTVLDQERFARDRPALLAETMFRSWDQESGDQAYSAFQDVVRQLQTTKLEDYIAASRAHATSRNVQTAAAAQQAWEQVCRTFLDGEVVAPGLDRDAFLHDPAVVRYMGKRLGCFDCAFDVEMDRPAFGREFHKWTQAHNVRQAAEAMGSARHFESGRDGERAARTYWVPIWALLFSMLGAFTHIFKMIFTVTEYSHRTTFNRIKAADSPLAHQIIRTSSIVTAAVVLGIVTFVYFIDNRITGDERYVQMRPRMWQSSPIVGGLAAHWTVNAQGLLYPFTRKIRPQWLSFDKDPAALLPFVKGRAAGEGE